MFLWLKFTVSFVSSLWKRLVLSRSRVRSVWRGPVLASPHFTSRSMWPRLRAAASCRAAPRAPAPSHRPGLRSSRTRGRGAVAAVARLGAGGWLGPEPHGAALSFATLAPARPQLTPGSPRPPASEASTAPQAQDRGRKMQRWIIVEQMRCYSWFLPLSAQVDALEYAW